MTDHRVNLTKGNIDGVLQGELDDFTAALEADEKRRKLEATLAGVIAVDARDVAAATEAFVAAGCGHAAPRRRAAGRRGAWASTGSTWSGTRSSSSSRRLRARHGAGSGGAPGASPSPTSSARSGSATSSCTWTRACSSRGPRRSCSWRWRWSCAGGRARARRRHRSGAIALALKDERPDLRVSASDARWPRSDVARRERRAPRAGRGVIAAVASRRASYDLVVANLPYVREDEWAGLAPEIREYEPREALSDRTASTRSGSSESRGTLALGARAVRRAVRALLDDAEHSPRPGRPRARDDRARARPMSPMTVGSGVTFERCIARRRGRAVSGRHGLWAAVDPDNEEASSACTRSRAARARSARRLMFFSVDALASGSCRTRAPPSACCPGRDPTVRSRSRRRHAGIRRARSDRRWRRAALPVLQTSANPSGGPDPRRLEDVDAEIRAGVDLELDGGELPGTPSTVVDARAAKTSDPAGRRAVADADAGRADAVLGNVWHCQRR